MVFRIECQDTGDRRRRLRHLGNFSKRTSLLTIQPQDGSAYPPWATQAGVPSGARPPAGRCCQAAGPWDSPCGSAPRPPRGLATASSCPMPAGARQQPTASPSRAVLPAPHPGHEAWRCAGRASRSGRGWPLLPVELQARPGDRRGLLSRGPPPRPAPRRGQPGAGPHSQSGWAAARGRPPPARRAWTARAGPGRGHTRGERAPRPAPAADLPQSPRGFASPTPAGAGGPWHGGVGWGARVVTRAAVAASCQLFAQPRGSFIGRRLL